MDHSATYRPRPARVKSVEAMTAMESLLVLEMEDGSPLGQLPGQFVQVSVPGMGESPISVCSSPTVPHSFELCVRKVGNVTRSLCSLMAGDTLGIRGPYGRGFPLSAMEHHDVCIVAGGIGIAPLRSLIAYVVDQRSDYGEVTIIYGTKSPEDLLFQRDVAKWRAAADIGLHLIVDKPDPAWRGEVGVVTTPLRRVELDQHHCVVVAAVGPPVMYKFVAMELERKGFARENIYFSLERRFKCGIGKCGHCQINDLYTCQHGPVFSYAELLGRTEAIEVWAPERDQDGHPARGDGL